MAYCFTVILQAEAPYLSEILTPGGLLETQCAFNSKSAQN